MTRIRSRFPVVAVHCCQRVLFCSWTRRRSREHWKFDLANCAPRHTSRRTFLPIWHIIIFLYAPCVFWGQSPQKLSICVFYSARNNYYTSTIFRKEESIVPPVPFLYPFRLSLLPSQTACSDASNDRMQELVFKHPLVWQNSQGGFVK